MMSRSHHKGRQHIGFGAPRSQEKGYMMKKKALRYCPELAGRMYAFFLNYIDARSAPSFSKFARSIGTTLRTLESFRKHKQFDRAWEECNEIRRDYLIDKALTKEFDPGFIKHLLSSEECSEESEESININITVSD